EGSSADGADASRDSLAQQPRGVGGAYAGAQARRQFRPAKRDRRTVLGHLPNPVRHGEETGSELLRVHLRARQRWCVPVAGVDRFKSSGSSAWRLLGSRPGLLRRYTQGDGLSHPVMEGIDPKLIFYTMPAEVVHFQ